jgi:tryptophan synthase beta subunit
VPLPADALILVGLSGRGDKDLAALERREATRS